MDARWLLGWAPFKIDALGLVTLLGADEVDKKIGRLSVSHTTELLPLIAGHVIAANTFTAPLPGLTIYNITDGIRARDAVGWFSRWLLCQKLSYNTTSLFIGTRLPRYSDRFYLWKPILLGLIVLPLTVILPCVMLDFWGLANAVALLISAFARFGILTLLRDAVDKAVDQANEQSITVVKTLWTLPDGSSVVVYTTRGILTECLLSSPKPASMGTYAACRAMAWVGFLVHILALGMAALPSQLICIAILGISTLCAVFQLGSDNEKVGMKLQIRRVEHTQNGSSMAAMFARLCLSLEEEEAMVEWSVMPLRKHKVWWAKYRRILAQNTSTGFVDWKRQESWAEFENAVQQSTN